MSPRYDIQLDNNGDLLLKDNDIIYNISDEQHIQDTINANPGWWMENFSDGVGIINFINSSGQQQILSRKIKIQLQSDLYTVTTPIITNVAGKLTINPNAS